MKRSNLRLEINAHTLKILTKNKTATGVMFQQSGQMKTVRASREVIISAGAVQSPQILELSGIGDPKILKEICPGVFGTIKPVGYCMIGKR